MEERNRDFDPAELHGLHTAIGRLQQFIELRERRGIDCTAARELITALSELAASMSERLKRQCMQLVGLLSQVPLLSDAAVLFTGA